MEVADLNKLRADLAALEGSIQKDQRTIAALEALVPWSKRESYALEKNDWSRLHRLADATSANELVFVGDAKRDTASIGMLLFEKAQVFVVANDWAGAFGDAIDSLDDELALPYPHCSFEFRISGKTVIAIALQPEGDNISVTWFAEIAPGIWAHINDGTIRAFGFAWLQIKAICIALESEVAVKEVLRAPAALNKKIARAGRCAVFDHHMVRLAPRHRVTPPDFQGGTGRRHRLHFRRGHWRHYEGRKTWIRWMLVGDPSLGFIDKHYSL
jgi:hypothetical protein